MHIELIDALLFCFDLIIFPTFNIPHVYTTFEIGKIYKIFHLFAEHEPISRFAKDQKKSKRSSSSDDGNVVAPLLC